MVSVILNKMIAYFGQDIRRINHALKVYGYAKAISGYELNTDKNRLIVELAAILHDIGIKEAERKYNSAAARYQEEEGPHIALDLVSDACIDKDIVERVCFLIGNHHSYDKIDGSDFQILVEADFLVNIDEGKIDVITIKTIKDKYFKTASGIRILSSLYSV